MSTEKIQSAMETRERILFGARRLLEAYGQTDKKKSVRMSDIAKEAGISRQAVYLHFETRLDLLMAVTRHSDELNDLDAQLVESRTAKTGIERLDAFVSAWLNYIPQVYGVARALMDMAATDTEAKAAYEERMQAVRHGCEAAVRDLKRDGRLSRQLPQIQAVDFLWTLLSIENWEHLTQHCKWPQKRVVRVIQRAAADMLVDHPGQI